MPHEPSDPLPTLIVLGIVAIGAIIALIARRRRLQRRRPASVTRTAWRSREPRVEAAAPARQARPGPPGPRPTDAADQLRVVMGAEFSAQPVLNGSEIRVFSELERAVGQRNPAWRVLAQVSLGEIVTSPNAQAYWCINAKRVDLLLVDEACRPRHAVEYQGGGHHQGMAAARDAVKREALRRAGIGYHEVFAGFTTPAELRSLVEKLVDRPGAAPRVRGLTF